MVSKKTMDGGSVNGGEMKYQRGKRLISESQRNWRLIEPQGMNQKTNAWGWHDPSCGRESERRSIFGFDVAVS